MQNKTCKYLLLFLNYNIKKIISFKFNGFELIARLKFLFSFFLYKNLTIQDSCTLHNKYYQFFILVNNLL